MASKEELFLYNDEINGNKIVLLYNDDDEDDNKGIHSNEVTILFSIHLRLLS